MAQGVCRRLCAIGTADLGENIAYMRGHGVEADTEGAGNVTVALAGSGEPQYLDFTRAQGGWRGPRCRVRRSRVFLLVGQARFEGTHA